MIAQLESSTCHRVILETSALIQAAQVIRITQAERLRGQSKNALNLNSSKKRFEKPYFVRNIFSILRPLANSSTSVSKVTLTRCHP